MTWYERAAQQGLAKAQNNLGYLYASGLGVRRDMEKAAGWYRRAAEQGEAKAQNNLAILYARGDGVNGDIPDPVAAVGWFEKAAAQDLADAQFRLAIVTEQGLGTQASGERALSLLRSAADLSHAGAQNSLDYRYSKGLGVEADYKIAAGWFARAAEQGVDLDTLEAQIDRNGGSVHRNLFLKMDVEGWEWPSLDATSDRDLVRFRQIVIELHGLGLADRFAQQSRVLSRLGIHFDVAHVHGNNNRAVRRAGDLAIPQVLEVTYVRKGEFRASPSTERYPLSDVDSPNRRRRRDLELDWWLDAETESVSSSDWEA